MKKSVLKKAAIVSGSLAIIFSVTLVALYENFIGFERASLERRFPKDTLLAINVKHVRKAGLQFATDARLIATSTVIQAIAKIYADASEIEETGPDTGDIDEELLWELGSAFKGQIILAAVPHAVAESEQPRFPDIVLAAHFSGSEKSFYNTLVRIAEQAFPENLDTAAGSAAPFPKPEWQIENWENINLYSIELPEINEPFAGLSYHPDSLPLAVAWCVLDDVLYMSGNINSLKRASIRHRKLALRDSFAARPEIRELPSIINGSDLNLFVDVANAAREWTRFTHMQLELNPASLLQAVSLPTLATELGIDSTDSLTYAIELTGERKTYLGIRYKERKGFWTAFKSTSTNLPNISPSEFGITETSTFNTGHGILVTKDAILKAAPLTGFLYPKIKSEIESVLGYDPENFLASAFDSEISLQVSPDARAIPGINGLYSNSLVFDKAFTLKLKEPRLVKDAVAKYTQFASSRLKLVSETEISEIPVWIIEDPVKPSDRIGLSIHGNYLVVGVGSLDTFSKSVTAIAALPESRNTEINIIGQGELQLTDSSTRFAKIAPAFYQEVNPGKPIPEELENFDWNELEALDQKRISTTYFDEANKRLYRISRAIE